MLLKRAALEGIKAERITVAFRRWRRPTVRAGGTLMTAIGVLSIDRVDEVDLDDITEADSRAAGYGSLGELRQELARRDEGTIFRIAFHYAGTDPRLALRVKPVDDDGELRALRARLARWDDASRSGPWTSAAPELIRERPGVRAADLAEALGADTKRFKANVRKLKGLGLTESLEIGYRLTPRGEAFLSS